MIEISERVPTNGAEDGETLTLKVLAVLVKHAKGNAVSITPRHIRHAVLLIANNGKDIETVKRIVSIKICSYLWQCALRNLVLVMSSPSSDRKCKYVIAKYSPLWRAAEYYNDGKYELAISLLREACGYQRLIDMQT